MNLRSILAGMLMLVMSACASVGDNGGAVPLGPLGQRVSDAVITVSPENRDLRVCWLASGAVEVITDLAQRGGRVEAHRALGHVMMLQGAIDNAGSTSTHWVETDSADVALMFAGVLKDVGKTRLAQILIGGPTLSNFLDIAQRTVVLTVKGHAVMRDINRTLQGVEDGVIDKADAFAACADRAAMNRNLLLLLTGATTLSSTETMAPTLSKDILAEGWLDEKQFIAEGWRDWGTLSSTSFFGVAPNRMAEYDIITPNRELVMQTAELDFVRPFADAEGWGGIPFGLGDPGSSGIGDPKDGDVRPDGWKDVFGYTEFVQLRGEGYGGIIGGGSGDVVMVELDLIRPDGWLMAEYAIITSGGWGGIHGYTEFVDGTGAIIENPIGG